ncbi:gamma-glutamylcyclotransferase-like isoform X2 [Oratosquilla oratoria]|uniref:gamma-glutamylcyclotransferase-like isoform X2 n=1 Tax=Oratosquilla oratoria TaxID=337810 RepID=UPI003F75FA54
MRNGYSTVVYILGCEVERVIHHKMAGQSTFMYFAYGSNLYAKRIHINNPSAKKAAIGELKNFRLDFNYYSRRWKGAAATIEESDGDSVWGVLWEVHLDDMDNLDMQEGVHQQIYRPLQVKVLTGDGKEVNARTYQIIRPVEEDRRPSTVYKNVILTGARENGLPEEYIKKLESIEDNGYNGEVDVQLNLLDKN